MTLNRAVSSEHKRPYTIMVLRRKNMFKSTIQNPPEKK